MSALSFSASKCIARGLADAVRSEASSIHCEMPRTHAETFVMPGEVGSASTLSVIMPKALIQNLRGFAADLTRKRVRGHAVLLGLVLWRAYAINITTPKHKERKSQHKEAENQHNNEHSNIARLHDASILYDASLQS